MMIEMLDFILSKMEEKIVPSIEEALRKAEQTLKNDIVSLSLGDNNAGGVTESNKYYKESERNELINRLLKERQEKNKKKSTVDTSVSLLSLDEENIESEVEDARVYKGFVKENRQEYTIHINKNGSVDFNFEGDREGEDEEEKEDENEDDEEIDRSNREQKSGRDYVRAIQSLDKPTTELHNHSQMRNVNNSTPTKVSNANLPFSRMAERAQSNRLTREEIAEQIRQEQLAECTFKPKINKNSTNKSSNKKDWLRRISDPGISKKELRKLENEKRLMEDAELTFTPRINNRFVPNEYARQSVVDRLHKDARSRYEILHQMKEEMEKNEIESHPFNPSINQTSKAIVQSRGYVPIHKRVNQLQRDKNEYMALLKDEVEKENTDLRFQPVINETSKAIVSMRGEGRAFNERLIEDAENNVIRKMQLSEAWHQKLFNEYKFEPSINEISEKIVTEKREFQGKNKDFLTRQKIFQEKREAKVEMLFTEIEGEQNKSSTFNPSIGNAEAVLVTARPSRLSETNEDMIHRLSSYDAQRREAVRNNVHDKYYDQFDFKPKTNAISSSLVKKSKTVDELTQNEESKRYIDRLIQQAQEEEAHLYTFKPNIPTLKKIDPNAIEPYTVISNDPHELGKRIEEYRKEKKLKIEDARKAKEYDELKECTFVPLTNSHVPQSNDPVVVRGLGRYLELKEMAKRREEEMRLREEKVFHSNVTKTKIGFTIPQPFRLDCGKKSQEKKRKILADIEAEQVKNCPFKPKTSQAMTRKTIKKLLDDALRLDIKKKLDAVSARVKAVDIHPEETWVLSALYNGNLLIWDYKTQAQVKSFDICARDKNLPVRSGKFVARQQWVIAGSDDYMISVFNYNTMEKVKSFDAHTDYIRCIDVHPTLPYVISCSDDMKIKLWDWSKNWNLERTFDGHVHFVMMVKFNPKDPQRFASASLDSTIKVWGITGSTPHFSLEGHDKGVNCIDFYPFGDKPYLISGSDDMTVKIWDYQTKAIVQTLTGHTKNITAATYHPRLPVIITASEDHTVRFWHNTTYRLTSTLNYGKERAWCIANSKDDQKIAIGFDEGTVVLKVGHTRPVVSMDSNGKCIWTVNNEVFTASLKGLGTEVSDGDIISSGAKEMGTCEVFPQSLSHNSKGTFFAVCGNGEYIIYTTIRLRNKAYGSALDFVWNASGSGDYAIRESQTSIKTYKNFTEAETFRPPFSAEGLFGGPALGVRSNDFVVFYDWETCNLIRRIDVCPKEVYWNDNADLVVFACSDEFYVLKYNGTAVSETFSKGPPPPEGVPAAFELIHKVNEKVRTGQWIGDCFLFTSGNKLNYFVGGEVMTHCHLDKAKYMLGFVAKDNRVYMMDKSKNIISYALLESVLQYQTAVVRRDFNAANAILPSIPQSQRNAVSRFLESQGFKAEALAVSDDPDHKFDLAIQLNNLDLACHIMKNELKADKSIDIQEKWKRLGDLALDQSKVNLAEECLSQAGDVSGLLLLYTSTGNAEGVQRVAADAAKKGKINIAFVSYFISGKIEECIELLLTTKRIPEAAFLARTYMPSEVSRIVALWRTELAKVSKRAAASLAGPDDYKDKFADLEWCLKAEQLFKINRGSRNPASSYTEHEGDTSRNMVAEVQELAASGKLEAILSGTKNNAQSSPTKMTPKVEQVVSPIASPPVSKTPTSTTPVVTKNASPVPTKSPVSESKAPVEEGKPKSDSIDLDDFDFGSNVGSTAGSVDLNLDDDNWK